MKIIVGTMLSLALAGSPLFAGQEPDDKDKPKQEEPKKEQPKPKPKQEPKQEPKPDDQPKPKPEPKQQPAPAPRPEDKQKQEDERRQQDEKQRREQPQTRNDRTPVQQQPQERGHGRGQRIPEERFRASFGREHHFRVTHHEDRRFQYGGYYFELVEAWPADWIFDDDCIIEADGDDYYLVDIVHPERRVLVIIVEG